MRPILVSKSKLTPLKRLALAADSQFAARGRSTAASRFEQGQVRKLRLLRLCHSLGMPGVDDCVNERFRKPVVPSSGDVDRSRFGWIDARFSPSRTSVCIPVKPPKLIVRDLRKRYGQTEAVRGVSFTIASGEIFGLLGPNGAGKTSTLECLVGLREPDGGDREICGVDARHSPAEVKQKIGVALQSTSLPDKMTPREALELFGSFYRERAETSDLLKRFDLVEKSEMPFDALSGGQKQRLALALAFINRPELVILDEPTTGLDPQARHELHQEILRMKADGYTVLLSTHYLEEAEKLCDRIAIMDRGVVVATGTTRELIAASDAQQVVSLTTDLALSPAALATLPGINELTIVETEVTFRTVDATSTLVALSRLLAEATVQIVDLQIRKASLEDLFLRLTQDTEGGVVAPEEIS